MTSSCFAKANGKKPTMDLILENRARSAYSAYNGGAKQICRYMNKKDRWAGNDTHFFDVYDNQPWMKYVTDTKAVAGVNTKCIVEGDDLCAMTKAGRDTYIRQRPLVLANGKTCLTSDGVNFSCASDMRVFSCLAQVNPDTFDRDPLKMAKLPEAAKVTDITDREALCSKAVQGLYKVGATVRTEKEVVMRSAIGGAPTGSVRAGRTFQVLDYDIRLGGKSERYYKIKTSSGGTGWIFGGSDSDHAKWITGQASAAAPAPVAKPVKTGVASNAPKAPVPTVASANEGDDTAPVLPGQGSIIEITKEGGIALRAAPGEPEKTAPLNQILKGARLTVLEVQTKGTDNQMYLKVTQAEQTGWIYVGHTFPTVTVDQWIKLWQ